MPEIGRTPMADCNNVSGLYLKVIFQTSRGFRVGGEEAMQTHA
jgi:hypothetical protein